MLVSKDATIREIHHRVKNNLQTISSLLRLQGRRLTEPSAKTAIEESVRRIRSIALVHEILSRDTGDDVAFGEVLRPLVRMVEEGLVGPEQPVRFTIEGDAGHGAVADRHVAGRGAHRAPAERRRARLPARARPAASVPGGGAARVHQRRVRPVGTVTDDGVGMPEDFDLAPRTSLGLSIVRNLVDHRARRHASSCRVGHGRSAAAAAPWCTSAAGGDRRPPTPERRTRARPRRDVPRGSSAIGARGGGVSWPCAGGRPTPGGACGAPLRRCRPRRRSPGWS